jgi:site-specific recombinase XerD
VAEEELDISPLARVRQPRKKKKLIPIIGEDQTRRVLDTCDRRTFVGVRDEAIIRMFANTGARLSEVADLKVDDLDMSLDTALYHGKGAKDRKVRFGPKTARALSRYLRARSTHRGKELPFLWLAEKGAARLTDNGIQVDPDGVLCPEDRAERVRHAVKAYMLQLAERSIRSRRSK